MTSVPIESLADRKNLSARTQVRIALTGGPGAGKTACMRVIGARFPALFATTPEVATMLFGGGFPRSTDVRVVRPAQRAIYHVQVELETAMAYDPRAVVLFDRGTVDSAAYWPGAGNEFWDEIASNLSTELRRYDAVIHLHTPTDGHGYDRGSNIVRTEDASEALVINRRVFDAWSAHPRRFEVHSTEHFTDKVQEVCDILQSLVPLHIAEQMGPR